MAPLDPAGAAVLRASKRAAAVVHEELSDGLDGLATTTVIAPWLGLLSTVVAIPNAFVGCGAEKSVCMAAVFERLATSMWPTALGLIMGLASLWSHRYLASRLCALDRDMVRASLDLINQIQPCRILLRTPPPTEPFYTAPLHMGPLPATHRRSAILVAATLLLAWSLQVVRYFDIDSLPLASAVTTAFCYVFFLFSLACCPAHFLWARLWRRRRGNPAVLAAAFCLSWCLIELVLRVHLL